MTIILSNIALIVCTKDRASYVQGFLEHMALLDYLPGTICIVDSSCTDETQKLVEGFPLDQEDLSVNYLHTHPGAPHQKNVGLDFLMALNFSSDLEIVAFLDDDIRPKPDYFAVVDSIFKQNELIACCGGFDQALNPPATNILRRLFLLAGASAGGEILPSGICTTVVPHKEIQRVDWVPGGMQSFRWDDIRSLRFNGRIRIYGDEVELQTRLKPERLVVTSTRLPVIHLGATLNKDRVRDEQAYMDGFRWFLAVDKRGGVKRFPVLLTTVALLVSSIVLFCLGGGRKRHQEFLGHIDFFARLLTGREVQQLVSPDVLSN